MVTRSPARVIAGGYDVTDKMPLTAAALDRQRSEPESDVPAVGAPMPTSIGLCADEYARVRQIRLAMEKEVEGVAARESELRKHIIANLSASDDTGAAGKHYRAQIVIKVKPKLADWTALTKVIQETGRFDLLQKRLGEKAIEGLWTDGYDVPGIERINIHDVSITKI